METNLQGRTYLSRSCSSVGFTSTGDKTRQWLCFAFEGTPTQISKSGSNLVPRAIRVFRPITDLALEVMTGDFAAFKMPASAVFRPSHPTLKLWGKHWHRFHCRRFPSPVFRSGLTSSAYRPCTDVGCREWNFGRSEEQDGTRNWLKVSIRCGQVQMAIFLWQNVYGR